MKPETFKAGAMTKTIAEYVWIVGIVAWYVIRHPYVRRSKKTAVSASWLDRREWILLSSATIGLSIVPLIYVVTGQPSALERPFVPATAWAGVVVLVLALWLFRRSHSDLGSNWSASLKIRTSHRLVTTGVYSSIRHPMYSSFFLLGLAQLLLLPNWVAGLSGVIGTAILYGFRVRREEEMMQKLFADDYAAYAARTKRIIPKLL